MRPPDGRAPLAALALFLLLIGLTHVDSAWVVG